MAECGGVTRLMMCTWHQHCSIYTICRICTLATYLPISPRQTRAEVGLNTALGRVTLVLVTDTSIETMGGSDEDLKHWILWIEDSKHGNLPGAQAGGLSNWRMQGERSGSLAVEQLHKL